MTKCKILIDSKIPFIKMVLEPFADVEYLSPEEFTNVKVKEADALIIRTRTKCNSKLLDNSNVKMIATATIGFDHINTKYCEANNIKWVNAPGCNSFSVQQYVASALLTLAAKKEILLKGKTIGIIGVGNVGSKIKKLCENLGMNVLLNDPPRVRSGVETEFVSLDEIVKKSDIITFHVPLNLDGIDKTFHLADESFFDKFDQPKIIINSSRGEVVKTSAIKSAIKNGFVEACILDVWENEPDIDMELLEMADIATPHIAGYSVEGKANGTAVCVNAVNNYFNLGAPLNWYPNDLPVPNEIIEIETNSRSGQEIFTEIVLKTYNVLNDDKLFRSSVSSFEKQRGNYPPRREFTFYRLDIDTSSDLQNRLKNLGFSIIS